MVKELSLTRVRILLNYRESIKTTINPFYPDDQSLKDLYDDFFASLDMLIESEIKYLTEL